MQGLIVTWVHQLGTLEFWETLLAGFEDLGPVAPILLAMVESFFTPLPLIAIVALNVAAHGGILGFLYSRIGVAVGGAIGAFLLSKLSSKYIVIIFAAVMVAAGVKMLFF